MKQDKLIELEIVKNDLLKSISDRFSISYELLLDELSKIERTRIVRSKYSCNHNFFSKDDEKSFYWAGFIAADGCVYKRSNSKTLNIALAEKDLSHLIRFKNDVEFDGLIYKSISKHSNSNPNWNDSIKRSLQISSPQLFEDLKRFNIVPDKTKIYTFPEWLRNHEMANHFMRGYVDGDGSFFYDKSRNRVCFELRGTLEFLEVFKEILEKNLSTKTNVSVTTPDSTSKIKYYGKKVVPQIVDFFYKDATIFLLRKYEIAKKSSGLYDDKSV
jgi:hypothetical protein